MTGNQRGIWDKYRQYIIIGVMYLFYVYPIVQPFSTGIAIGEKAQNLYDLVESLPDGANILMVYDYSAMAFPIMQGIQEAFLEHIWRKDGNVVMISFSPDGPMMYKKLLGTYVQGFSKKEYGKDWVFLGYLPGGETGLTSFMKDIRGTISSDFEGDPIDTIPIMENINLGTDFDFVFDFETGVTMADGFVRQVASVYGIKLAFAMSGGQMMEPYYPDLVQALVYPLPGRAAEYETLIGVPGNATSQLAIIFVGNLFILIVLLGGAISQIYKRLSK